MVEVGTGTKGTRFIARDYPVEEGLEAGTTKQEGTKARLEAEQGSFIPQRKKQGLGY